MLGYNTRDKLDMDGVRTMALRIESSKHGSYARHNPRIRCRNHMLLERGVVDLHVNAMHLSDEQNPVKIVVRLSLQLLALDKGRWLPRSQAPSQTSSRPSA
jgi:hypothetical protein